MSSSLTAQLIMTQYSVDGAFAQQPAVELTQVNPDEKPEGKGYSPYQQLREGKIPRLFKVSEMNLQKLTSHTPRDANLHKPQKYVQHTQTRPAKTQQRSKRQASVESKTNQTSAPNIRTQFQQKSAQPKRNWYQQKEFIPSEDINGNSCPQVEIEPSISALYQKKDYGRSVKADKTTKPKPSLEGLKNRLISGVSKQKIDFARVITEAMINPNSDTIDNLINCVADMDIDNEGDMKVLRELSYSLNLVVLEAEKRQESRTRYNFLTSIRLLKHIVRSIDVNRV